MTFPKKSDIKTLSIVLLGDFNPLIFQPAWLAKNELISEGDGAGDAIEVMHRDLVKIGLNWVDIQITPERIEFKSSQEPYFDPIKDLIVSIFNILVNTPIRAIGINHIYHYKFDETSFYELGDKISPLSNWDEIINNPRVLRLDIHENERMDGLKGHYRIRIEPSDRIKPFGVALNINDHYGVKDEQFIEGSSEVVSILQKQWKKSLERATNVPSKLWENLS